LIALAPHDLKDAFEEQMKALRDFWFSPTGPGHHHDQEVRVNESVAC
jgi:hypothetical protein